MSGVRLARHGSTIAAPLARHAVLAVVTLAAIIPIYFMVTTAFKSQVQYAESQLGLPLDPSLTNFATVLGNPMFVTWMLNSILLTIVSVGLGIAVSSAAAYAFAWVEFRGRRLLFITFVALLGAPAVAMVIPLFRMMVEVNLVNSRLGAVIIYTGLMIPYTTYFLTAFFRRLPDAVFEAGRVDGCGHFSLFLRIALPLSKPGLVTLALVNTLWVWNELLIAIIFLQETSKRTLMAGLTLFQGEFSSDVPAIMAGLVVAMLPMLVLYVTGLRYFLSGFMMGSEK